MNKIPQIFLLSIGPAAGVDVLHLETAHLSGLLKKNGLKYCYVEVPGDFPETLELHEMVEGEGVKPIILFEARFERYRIVKSIVLDLRERYPDVTIILWGPMTDPAFEMTLCPFLKGTRKSLKGPAGVIEEVFQCLSPSWGNAVVPQKREKSPFGRPDYSSMPMEAYIGRYLKSGRCWNLWSSKGCASGCTFCSRARGKVSYRDVECLIEEISWLQREHEINKFSFVDDNFLNSHKRIRKVLKAIDNLKHPISFRFQGRVDRLTEPILIEMMRCGLSGISMGIESGNQEILDSLNKNLNLSELWSALELLNKHDTPYHGTFLLGAPLESEASVQDTFHLIQTFFKNSYRVCYIKPLPGTSLYRQAVRSNKIRDEKAYCETLVTGYDDLHVNLTQYDDATMMGWRKHLEGNSW